MIFSAHAAAEVVFVAMLTGHTQDKLKVSDPTSSR